MQWRSNMFQKRKEHNSYRSITTSNCLKAFEKSDDGGSPTGHRACGVAVVCPPLVSVFCFFCCCPAAGERDTTTHQTTELPRARARAAGRTTMPPAESQSDEATGEEEDEL